MPVSHRADASGGYYNAFTGPCACVCVCVCDTCGAVCVCVIEIVGSVFCIWQLWQLCEVMNKSKVSVKAFIFCCGWKSWHQPRGNWNRCPLLTPLGGGGGGCRVLVPCKPTVMRVCWSYLCISNTPCSRGQSRLNQLAVYIYPLSSMLIRKEKNK